MSTAQRALFVLFALAAAGGVGFLLLEMREDTGIEELDLAPPVRRETPPRVVSDGAELGSTTPIVRSEVIRDEEDPDGTSLTVLVVDEQGGPLPEATIVLTGPEGARVEGQGALAWAEATAGSWRLTVEAPGLLPYRRDVVVEAGARSRVTAQLRDHVPLQGVVLDLFGRPVDAQSLWLLGEGSAHPEKGENVKDRVRANSSRTGEFTLRVPAEGVYRISVGGLGEELVTSAPLDLHLGGPERLEVVVADGGMLSVEMDNLSPGLQEGRVVLRVAVLKQRRNSGADDGGRRRREGGRRAESEATEEAEEAGEDPGVARVSSDAGPGDWREVATLALDREGRAKFSGLPIGSDLRLAFLRKNDRFETETPFVLQEGQRAVARFSMPPKRTPQEIATQPVGVFYSATLVDTGADELRQGIRFVE